jgi:hypothetical protein
MYCTITDIFFLNVHPLTRMYCLLFQSVQKSIVSPPLWFPDLCNASASNLSRSVASFTSFNLSRTVYSVLVLHCHDLHVPSTPPARPEPYYLLLLFLQPVQAEWVSNCSVPSCSLLRITGLQPYPVPDCHLPPTCLF